MVDDNAVSASLQYSLAGRKYLAVMVDNNQKALIGN